MELTRPRPLAVGLIKQKRQGRQRALVNTRELEKESQKCVPVYYTRVRLYSSRCTKMERRGCLCADLVGA